MKNLSMLVWFSQLGVSVAVPPAILVWLSVWIKDRLKLGAWVIWIGVALGIYCAIRGLISSLRAMEKMAQGKKKDPSVAFNDHM